MKLDKKTVVAALEAEYVNGTETLQTLAKRFGCTAQALSYYGRLVIPNWKNYSQLRIDATRINMRPKKLVVAQDNS